MKNQTALKRGIMKIYLIPFGKMKPRPVLRTLQGDHQKTLKMCMQQ